jgi:hypothetical protein
VQLNALGIGLLGDLRYRTSLHSIFDASGLASAYNSVWTLSAGVVF